MSKPEDFDGDGRTEIAIAPDIAGTAGNDFWAMKFQGGSWQHMSPIPGHPYNADFDCSPADFAARFAVAANTFVSATQAIIRSSGDKSDSYVSGSAQVGIQRNGIASFRGHVYERSIILSHQYVFAVAFLDVKDADGKILVFAHQGKVEAKGDPFGTTDDSWQEDGFNQLLVERWDEIKNSRYEFRLKASIDPLPVLETVLVDLFIGVGAAFFIVVFVTVAGSNPKCHWSGDPESQGADFICTDEQ